MTKPRQPENRGRNREAEDGTSVPFGTWLRSQREARGVSLREIADSTRISLRYLEALEADRFDALPAPVFARGFLREYARVVGLDADEVVNLFLVAARVGSTEESAPSPPTRSSRVGNPWGYGLLLGAAMVLLLAVAVALSFWAERRGRAAAPVASSVVPPAATDAVVAAPAVTHDEGAPVQPTAAAIATPAAAPSDAVAASAVPPPNAPAPAALPSNAPLVVAISFSGDCWVEAVVDGRRRPGELKIAGETLTLEGNETVVLTLGNRSGAIVTANGRPISLPVSGTNVVRNFRIERSALSGSAGNGGEGTN